MFFCLMFVMPLCASVYMCLAVTCCESTDLLALVVMCNCEFYMFFFFGNIYTKDKLNLSYSSCRKIILY